VPASIPSTLTCTLLIALPIEVVLSMAQPETVVIPDIAVPDVNESMYITGSTAAATATVME
jgi:hypothetical protein